MTLAQESTWINTIPRRDTFLDGALKTNFTEPSSLNHYSIVNLNKELENLDRKVNVQVIFGDEKAALALVHQPNYTHVCVWAFDTEYLDQAPDYSTGIRTYRHSVRPSSSRREVLINNPSANLSWLRGFYEVASRAQTASDIYPLVSGIADLFGQQDYISVDNILESAPLEKLSVTAMVTLVRTTFPAREKLKTWNDTVLKIQNILISKGENSQQLLRGLL